MADELRDLRKSTQGADETPSLGTRGDGPDSDPQLLSTTGRLDPALQEVVPSALERIGAHIRENPDKFVQFVD